MKTTEMTPESVQAAALAIPKDRAIVMLNLLRYRKEADYGDGTEFAPCSGREAYFTRYIPAFNAVATERIRPTFLGDVQALIVGPADEPWDDVVLVEYSSYAAFRSLVESPEYKAKADPHRRAALEDWRLIATLKVAM